MFKVFAKHNIVIYPGKNVKIPLTINNCKKRVILPSGNYKFSLDYRLNNLTLNHEFCTIKPVINILTDIKLHIFYIDLYNNNNNSLMLEKNTNVGYLIDVDKTIPFMQEIMYLEKEEFNKLY